ncbi:DUF896 domain-containing protein [Saccharibacillus sp. CPCC 101409]|uniref:DUF896 domain-containing protein n=1 Tax=Saccharibacillus sp. CPCC 101409 TaxID=3058041 RepID=UPI002673B568|nr:DUF896 domain-containing protein [Saccharibacillus sp. CPCC 101409]MDO3412832.1 DUF896 domain-containing protein [Saccharibacillus sp. CPCC 101409]
MDIDALVGRINELARKHKAEGLSEEEAEERTRLREIYLGNVRRNFRQQLDSIEWTDEEQGGGKLH